MSEPKWERVRFSTLDAWWEAWTAPDWGWTPCQELSDPDKDAIFFPPSSMKPTEREYHRKRVVDPVCGECPVRTKCAQYAIEVGIPEGWWGGMSPQERVVIRRERAGGRLHGDKTRKVV